jgi:hypothetical protein
MGVQENAFGLWFSFQQAIQPDDQQPRPDAYVNWTGDLTLSAENGFKPPLECCGLLLVVAEGPVQGVERLDRLPHLRFRLLAQHAHHGVEALLLFACRRGEDLAHVATLASRNRSCAQQKGAAHSNFRSSVRLNVPRGRPNDAR